jgi:TetR/AcrR family acrAB operon transcriptional repressor
MRRTKAGAEETRQSILCAAERVFYDKGVAEATLEDVARAAGVTRGAIYWHFANKTELLIALHDCVPLPQEDMLPEEVEANARDPLGAMERKCVAWLADIANDERRQRIYTILMRCDYSDDMADILDRQKDLDDAGKASVRRAFEDAAVANQLAEGWTPDVASRCFIWMVKGLYLEWLRYGRRFDLAAEGKICLAQLFASFRRKAG